MKEPNLQDGINWLMNDLSMVPNGIIDKIAEYLETLNYNTSIQNNEISFKGNYNEFKLFLNEDLSAKLNLYIHAASEYSELHLKKMASTPNLEHRIKRIIESDNEYIFSVDIPPMTAKTYQEQLEYYIKLLHDYEFDLFLSCESNKTILYSILANVYTKGQNLSPHMMRTGLKKLFER